MSKRRFLLLTLLLAVAGGLSAQDHIVKGTSPTLYLVHKVVAKENWYSIGRIYNLSPKDIAAYNKLSMDKSLAIDQELRIPLTSTNFSQDESKAKEEVLVPVYHIVQEKEWLFRIGQNHNKVPVERLEKWNNLTKDGAKPGTKLIVGYLKVKEGNAVLASSPASTSSSAPAETKTPEPVIVKKEPVKEEEVKKPEAPVQNKQVVSQDGGYFRRIYVEGGRNTSGVTGIFKSTSGWNDGKYYALMNNVPVGTIIKISYPQSSKTVYAKVLGELPEMRESAGLALRISDAAASELGAAENKFSVNVMY